MFNRKKQEIAGTIETIIGANVVIAGTIVGKTAIRLDGWIEGEINCEGDVIIGQTGRVKGNVRSRNIMISGQVAGDVTASQKLEITQEGKLLGNIQAGSLVIAEGAFFHGRSEMTGQEQVKEEPGEYSTT